MSDWFRTGSVIFKLHTCGEKKAAFAIPELFTALITGMSILHMTGFFPTKGEEAEF